MAAEINNKNFKRLCGLNGITPAQLAKRIGRHRVSIYRALRDPRNSRPTYDLISGALPIRSTPKVNGH